MNRSEDYAICAYIRLATFVYGHRIRWLRTSHNLSVEREKEDDLRTDSEEVKVAV